MKCPQCKHKIPEKAKFCPYCREKIVKKHLKISNKLLLGFALLQVFIIAVIALNAYMKSDKFVLYLLKEQKYAEATEKINQNSNLQDSPEIYNYISQSVKDNESEYIDENIDYLKAEGFLDNFREINMDNVSEIITNSDNLMKKIFDSRIEFNNGESELKKGDYENAVKYYQNVVKEDTEYYNKSKNQIEFAENKIEEEIEKAKNSALELANTFENEQSYRDAINQLQNAEVEFGSDNDFVKQCKDKEKNYFDEWIENIKQENNYFGNESMVAIATEFKDIFSDEQLIDDFINEGQNFEKENFIKLLNEKRSESAGLKKSNDINIDIAQKLLENPIENNEEERSLINDNLDNNFAQWKQWVSFKPYGYNSAEEILNENVSEDSDFNDLYSDTYNYIDVAMKYNKDDKTCYWYIILIR